MSRYSSVLLLELKTSQLYILKTKLGGEIYASDANIHKGFLLEESFAKSNCNATRREEH